MVWGDVATWVGSIGTVLALGVAVVLLAQGVRDRTRAQARLVTPQLLEARVEHKAGTKLKVIHDDDRTRASSVPQDAVRSFDLDDEGQFDLKADVLTFRSVLRNDSDEMIGPWAVALVDPRGTEVAVLDRGGYLAPHSTRDYVQACFPQIAPTGDCEIRVRFLDAVGRGWERMPGRQLKRLRGESSKPPVPQPVPGTWRQVSDNDPRLRIKQ